MKPEHKLKIGVVSLGCPRNLTDTESILGNLSAKGYPVVDISEAEVGIVNTCAFIADAKQESIEAILDLAELKRKGSLKKLIVCGCLAQRYKNELRRQLPEVDAFVGTPSLNHSRNRFAVTPRHYAYLKICEGCVHNCSYCVIPRLKGKFASLEIESVLEKVAQLDRGKTRELNLIGQDISGYGLDLYKTRRLPQLLKKIIASSGDISWIRLLYLYPDGIVDEVLEIIRDEPKVCKYIDLPIQHVNDRILKLMNRKTTQSSLLKLIAKVRKKVPQAAIRTSLIVGFPSETDKEFRELLAFVKEARFERLGAFIYSREEGTPAYDLPGQVPAKVKAARLNTLMLEQQKISGEINQTFLGKVIDVLIEEKAGDAYLGRSQYDAPEVDGQVYVTSEKELNPGELIPVNITDTLEYDLIGKAQ